MAAKSHSTIEDSVLALTNPEIRSFGVPATLVNDTGLAAKSFRRIEQGARRDYGQRFWWRPGTVLPRRGPDLGAVGG